MTKRSTDYAELLEELMSIMEAVTSDARQLERE